MKVQVFIKSEGIPKDIESIQDAHHHTYCAPGMTSRVMGLSDFDGRIVEPACAPLLSDLSTLPDEWAEHILIYDLGRLHGRLKAALAGIWKTPAIIVAGEKHIGLPAARRALRELARKRP